MSQQFVLTIDVGTSSTRALVFDSMGQPVAGVSAHEPNHVHVATDGTAELDLATLLEAFTRCVDAVLDRAAALPGLIVAVGLDTLASTFVALDAKHQPLTSLITYADTRNAEDAALLQRELGEATIHERTGCMLRTSYWPARLAWLRRTQPQLWQQTKHAATLGEYLELQLFGRSRVSLSAASWTGLLDRRTLEWDGELVRHSGLYVEQLGELVDVDDGMCGLAEPFCSRWPALANVPWFPAIGDGAAANIGSGCSDETTMALTVGTTGALRVARTTVEQVPHGLWCYRIDNQRALLGGATSEGGNVFQWASHTLQLEQDTQLEAALARIAPDSHGLTILPFFAGERSPGWAGDVRATISGMTLSTTPTQIARASLEAVAYRFAIIANSLRATGAAPPTIIASGGAMLASPTWMQTCADALGLPVTASAEPEATSRGVALLALASLDLIKDVSALPARLGATYTPNAENHAVYRAAIARQQALYKQLILGA